MVPEEEIQVSVCSVLVMLLLLLLLYFFIAAKSQVIYGHPEFKARDHQKYFAIAWLGIVSLAFLGRLRSQYLPGFTLLCLQNLTRSNWSGLPGQGCYNYYTV